MPPKKKRKISVPKSIQKKQANAEKSQESTRHETEQEGPQTTPSPDMRRKSPRLSKRPATTSSQQSTSTTPDIVVKNVTGMTDDSRADNIITAGVQNIGVLLQGKSVFPLQDIIREHASDISRVDLSVNKDGYNMVIQFKDNQHEKDAQTVWTFLTKPVKGVIECTKTCLSAICSLRGKFQNTHNATMTKVENGSLILTFEHETMKKAREMIEDKERVKKLVLDFLHSFSPEIEDITVQVEMKDSQSMSGKDATNIGIKRNSSQEDPQLNEVNLLKQKVEKLEETIEQMRQEKETMINRQLTDAKLMLLTKHRSAAAGSSTSGYHSASDDAEFTGDVGDTVIERKEEKLPEESSRWMLHDGETTLVYYNINHMLNEACRKGALKIVQELLSSGADINNRSKGGLTPVMIAAWLGYKQLYDVLVEKGCDLSLMLDDGKNILHVACFGGNVDIVSHIISIGIVDIESKGSFGGTAVMKAVTTGNKKVFDLLVSRGCDMTVTDDTGNNILHVACFSDNVDIVSYILSQHIVDIDSRGHCGRTPVMTAAEKGNKKVFDLLVNRGCDVTVTDDTGNNILHVACFSDNVDIVSYILSHQIVDFDSRGQYGSTPVMNAAENGNKKVFDLLVSRGCDMTVTDDTGNNILHVSCYSDNVDIVSYILSHHIVDIDSRGQYGSTPVMNAAEKGNKKVFDLLVSRGCDMTVTDDTGNNILHVSGLGDNVDIVSYILSHHIVDIDSRGQYGSTLVMIAAGKGNKKVFDLLVSRGCDMTVTDDTGNNILHFASSSDNVDIVSYILSHQIVDIDSRGQYGSTPVMIAAGKGNKKVFDLLVSRGCDMTVTDDTGNNILHVSCYSDNVDIVTYILSHQIVDIDSRGQYGSTPVMNAAENGNKKVFDLLVSRGCDMTVTDDTGNNILHFASFSDNVDIVTYILSHQIVDIDSRGQYGSTPVMNAAEKGNKKVFDLLVSRGCDMTVTDDTGDNILHVACYSDNVDIVSYILSHHIVDIDSRGQYGRTPVMTAAEKGNKKVFDLLVNRGCDMTVTDDTGNNILHVSGLGDNVDIVSYILSHQIVDIDSRGQYGSTPVMNAAEKGNKKVFDLLVSRGCDMTVTDDTSNNILHFASCSDNVDIVSYILSHHIVDIDSRGQYGSTPVMIAAGKGNKKVFDLLVSRGCDMTVTDDTGNNILHAACFSDNVDIVTYILSHQIVDIDSRGQYGSTPVMIAAEKGNKKVFDLLVSRGCSLTLTDTDGSNILHLASIGGNKDIVMKVISDDIVDINSRNTRGWTAVKIAKRFKHNQLVSLLISRGATDT